MSRNLLLFLSPDSAAVDQHSHNVVQVGVTCWASVLLRPFTYFQINATKLQIYLGGFRLNSKLSASTCACSAGGDVASVADACPAVISPTTAHTSIHHIACILPADRVCCVCLICNSMQGTFLLALLVLAGTAHAQNYKQGEWIAGRAT